MELLRKFWRDDIPIRTAFLNCAIGGAAILGFWIAWWFPVSHLVVIGGFLLGGAGSNPEHDVHMLWRGISYLLIFCCVITIPIGIWRSVAKTLSMGHAIATARLTATACALVAILALAAVGEFSLVM